MLAKRWIWIAAVVLLISLSTNTRAVTNRNILGLWQFGTLSIEFRADNTYVWKDEAQTLEGSYKIEEVYPNEGHITMYYEGHATHYYYSIDGDRLRLMYYKIGGPDRDTAITLTKIEIPYLSKPQDLFESPLIGVWINKEGNTTITLMFSKDGSYEVIKEELTGWGEQRTMNTGTYKIINSNITLISTDGERRTYPFSLRGDQLVVNEVVYVRKAKKKKEEVPLTSEKFYTPVFQTEDPTTILVAGNPPLTQEIIDLYYNFFEYAAKTKLTEAQRDLIKNSLIKEFQEGNLKQKTEVLKIKENWSQIEMLDPGQREILRVHVAKELVTEAQKDPNNPISQATLELFSNVNTILVRDNPPLTQQMIDAYFELCEFYSSISLNEKIRFSDEERKEFTQQLIEKYPHLPQSQKDLMNRIDVEWAKMRYAWNKLSRQERENARRKISATFDLNKISNQDKRSLKTNKSKKRGALMTEKEFRKKSINEMTKHLIFLNTMNFMADGNTSRFWGAPGY